MVRKNKRILNVGEEYYLCGSNTKVRVIRSHISKVAFNGDRSEVLVLESTKLSKYYKNLGKLVVVNNQVLYPRKNPKFEGKNVEIWNEN